MIQAIAVVGVLLLIGVASGIVTSSHGAFEYNGQDYTTAITTEDHVYNTPPCSNTNAFTIAGSFEMMIMANKDDVSKTDNWYSSENLLGYLLELLGYPVRSVYYTNTSTTTLDSWTAGTLTNIPAGYGLFPYVVYDETTSKYYLLGQHKNGDGFDTYLFNSTDKSAWNIMNEGQPVLKHSTDPQSPAYYIYNPAVWIHNGIWSILFEGDTAAGADATARLLYTESTLAEMNWTAHINTTTIIPLHGNPELHYFPSNNALVVVAGNFTHIVGSPGSTDIDAFYTDVSNGFSASNTWTKLPGFGISYTNKLLTDPSMVFRNGGTNNIGLMYMQDQNGIYTHAITSNQNSDDYFDSLKNAPRVYWGSVCP